MSNFKKGWILRDGAGNIIMDYDIKAEKETLFKNKRGALNRINNSLYPLVVKRMKSGMYDVEVIEEKKPKVSSFYILKRIDSEMDLEGFYY